MRFTFRPTIKLEIEIVTYTNLPAGPSVTEVGTFPTINGGPGTSTVMRHFYIDLLSGKSKDEAVLDIVLCCHPLYCFAASQSRSS